VNVIIVDTSSWIPYFKGEPFPEIDLALREGRVFLPSLVASELLSSQLKPSDRLQLVDFLKELPLCNNDFDHWADVGLLRSQLSKKGLHVSTPDAHVAQCAIDLQGYLITEDRVFKKVADSTSLKLMPS
jgi:tRNA(fMet)-specific endonuclease VapC